MMPCFITRGLYCELNVHMICLFMCQVLFSPYTYFIYSPCYNRVTHAVHILKKVNNILVLDKGKSVFYGNYEQLQNQVDHPALISMQSRSHLNSELDSKATSSKTSSSMEMPTTSDADAKKGELITDEQREHGMSSISIWLLWFQYAGGFFFIIVQIILMACDRGSYILIDWWLATWTSALGKEITVLGVIFPDQFDSQNPYLVVYSVLVLFMLIFLAARSQWAVFGGIRACRKVFESMTHHVL